MPHPIMLRLVRLVRFASTLKFVMGLSSINSSVSPVQSSRPVNINGDCPVYHRLPPVYPSPFTPFTPRLSLPVIARLSRLSKVHNANGRDEFGSRPMWTFSETTEAECLFLLRDVYLLRFVQVI